MNRKRRLKIQDFNPHLICVLCRGYFIDATTIIECLHSFCRACIVQYLESNRFCPICDVQVHKSKPLQNIRKDSTLQDLVYKLVPGLFQSELRNRREFFAKHPDAAPCTDITDTSIIYMPEECFTLTLEHWKDSSVDDDAGNKQEAKCSTDEDGYDKDCRSDEAVMSARNKRYLRCPAAVTVAHLHKLIRAKYGLHSSHAVELLYRDEPLQDQLSLIDIAYIYKWRRKGPLNLSYRIFESYKRRKLEGSNICTNSHLNPACLSQDESEMNAFKKQIKTEDLEEKVSDWKEVQLQISETGIMSVTGISLEHNNNLTNANNNTIEKACNTDKHQPSVLTSVVSQAGDLKLPSNHIENLKLANYNSELCELKGNATDQPIAKEPEPKIVVPEVMHLDAPSISSNHTDKSSSKESIDPSLNHLKAAEKTDADNAGLETYVPQRNNCDSYNSVPRYPKDIVKTSIAKQGETLDLSLKHNVSKVSKLAATHSALPELRTCALSSCSNSKVTPKTAAIKPETANHVENTIPAEHVRDRIITHKDKSNQYFTNPNNPSCLPSPTAKKSLNSNLVEYKTFKVPPKTWNSSITRSSNIISKNHSANLEPNTSNTNSSTKAVEKAPKFFKMRNMPRYLGNPASGVKPMYQVAGETKAQDSGSVAPTKHIVTKIDPKTLSPIVSVISGSCSTTSKSFYSLSQSSPVDQGDILSGALESSKKTHQKIDSSAYKNQVLAMKPPRTSLTPVSSTITTLTSSSSPSNVNYPRTGRTASPSAVHMFGDARSSPTMKTDTSRSNLLLKSPNFAINPATLNLLSSNLSFLPNASNFLYGNYNFPPPLIRPGLNLNSSPGGSQSTVSTSSNLGIMPTSLPPGLGAFHSMPPAINMLFPHQRSSDRSSNHPPTPAVQRIPASKGNNSSTSYKPANQNNHPQNTFRNQLPAKSNSLINPTNISDNNSCIDSLGHKLNSTYHTEQPVIRLEVNLNNNAVPMKINQIKDGQTGQTRTDVKKEAKPTQEDSGKLDCTTLLKKDAQLGTSGSQKCTENNDKTECEISLNAINASNISSPNKSKLGKEVTALGIDSLIAPAELIVKIDAGEKESDRTTTTDNNSDLILCNKIVKEPHNTLQNKEVISPGKVALEVKTGT